VTRPDFDELVSGDLEPGERERLQSVHELLLAAGPPPELPPSLVHPPGAREREAVVRVLPRGVPRRRLAASLVLAAALTLAAFGVGFLVGDREDAATATAAGLVKMVGTEAAPGAVASLRLFEPDEAGNRVIEMTIRGLDELQAPDYYELGLMRDGEVTAQCGTFNVEGDKTVVSFTVPYEWNRFEGWGIVAHYPARDRESPLLLTTAG
jgi:hypothetical protein